MQGSVDVWGTPMAAELVYELSLDEATPSNNVLKGMHFQAYKHMRRTWRMRVLAALQGRRPTEPIERAFLVVTRECAGNGLDWDNAYGGLKPMLDCLVRASEKNPDGLGLILDDNPSAMPFPPFVAQRPARVGKGRTTVKIYALAA